MAIIRLTTCYNYLEAHRIVDVLESAEIQCFTTNENLSTLMPIYNGMLGSGIQVMIHEEDLEQARALLEAIQPKQIIKCPYCDSQNIAFGLGAKPLKKIIQIVISLTMLAAVGRSSYTYYCKDCKQDFEH